MVSEHSLYSRSQAQSTNVSDHSPNSKCAYNLKDSVDYYLLTCKVESKSPKTLFGYSQRLSELTAFSKDKPVTPYSVRLFLLSLQERGLCANTISAYYRAMHSFFNWLIREGVIRENPMATIHPPKVPKKLVKPLSNKNIFDVLAIMAPRHSGRISSICDTRNTAIFLIFLDTGLRLDEMSQLQLSQVNIDKGIITVMGKGGKERQVRIGKMTHKALLRYWIMRREIDLPSLWITEEKTPLQRGGVQMAIRRMLRRAGCQGVKIGPHTLRHTAAMSYLRNGGDLATLQVMMGHADITTTKIYLSSLAGEDMMRVHERASPVDNLLK